MAVMEMAGAVWVADEKKKKRGKTPLSSVVFQWL